jgi:hypothetical protein
MNEKQAGRNGMVIKVKRRPDPICFLVTALLVFSMLTGSAISQETAAHSPETVVPKPAGPDISGQWQVVDSAAVFKISFIDGAIHMEGWDSGTGEKIRISDVQWDGNSLTLSGIFVQGKRTSYSSFLLTGPDTLKGAAGKVWKRQPAAGAPAPAAAVVQHKTDPEPRRIVEPKPPKTDVPNPPETVAPKPAGTDISGQWQVVESSAVFNITFVDGNIHIQGWDSSDGEQFRISDVQWDGKRLKGTFVMPSTNGTTYSNLLLVDPGTLRGSYMGDSSGVETWKRQPVAMPAPTGAAAQQKTETKPPVTPSPAPAGPDISGQWRVVDSTTVFKISFIDGAITIEGWDSASGEKFRISDVQWNGKRLSGIFILPSAKKTVYANLSLIDPDTFKSADGEVWKRN